MKHRVDGPNEAGGERGISDNLRSRGSPWMPDNLGEGNHAGFEIWFGCLQTVKG